MTEECKALESINAKFVASYGTVVTYPALTNEGVFNLYISPKAAWNMRAYGRQKRRKGFNLRRDLPMFYP